MIENALDADIYVVYQLDHTGALIVGVVFVLLTLALSKNICHMPALLDSLECLSYASVVGCLVVSLNSLALLGFACVDSDRDVDACCPLARRLLG